MIIAVVNFKGGVGKTTTAVHLAAALQEYGPTLLVDGDANGSATAWDRRGRLPCRVIGIDAYTPESARRVIHTVIDTQARPEAEDLADLARHLLILPTTPDALALDGLIRTVQALRAAGADRYRVLLTMTPPAPSKDATEAREMLAANGIPTLTATIRRRVAFQKAALAGTTVRDVADPRAADGWHDYQAMTEEILSL